MAKYILDTNVYIQAHVGYYNPDIAPNYWDLLKDFGNKDLIKSPKQVRNEISEKNIWLSAWKKDNKIFLGEDLKGIMPFFNKVREKYTEVKAENFVILRKQYKGKYNPNRDEPLSDADMFVIATVLFYKHNFPAMEVVLVTKENTNITAYKSVRIPHVCNTFGIRCIDDFEFLKEIGVKFDAKCNSR